METNKIYRNILTLLVTVTVLSGCNSDSGPKNEIKTIQNILPQISIFPISSQLRQGKSYILSAYANDPDGYIKKIEWQQLRGPTLKLIGKNTLNLSFTLPLINNIQSADVISYDFRLTVTDNENSYSTKEISFTSYYGMNLFEASHLLNQASMGPITSEINNAQGLTEEEWIQNQFLLESTPHSKYLRLESDQDKIFRSSRINAWWHSSITQKNQLKQKINYALSQIFVVSDEGSEMLVSQQEALTYYYDSIGKHVFGNFRELLKTVTLSPVMGIYLSHLGNKKSDPTSNTRPDENYAREVMQLFTIGLIELNQDGTPKLDINGNTIPTYTQNHIANFARVFTGWTYADATSWKWPHNFREPMEPWEEFHDKHEKTLLNGTVLPAGQSAQQDLDQALDNLFYHPNVPPFISKQLIQRLVTSNPTPQYVKRVADVFTDNGEGVRGDMAAVIKAILLDDEARTPNGVLQYSGKIREPLLRTVQFWRELNAASASNWFYTWHLNSTHGQTPLGSPSVFNFFRPDYQPPELQVWQSTSPFNSSPNAHLVAPELQIANDATLIGQFNHQYFYNLWRIKELSNDPHENTILLTLHPHVDRLNDQGLDALLDHYNILFFSGRMSAAMRQTLVNTHNIFANWSDYEKVGYLLFTISVSPEYVLQH